MVYGGGVSYPPGGMPASSSTRGMPASSTTRGMPDPLLLWVYAGLSTALGMPGSVLGIPGSVLGMPGYVLGMPMLHLPYTARATPPVPHPARGTLPGPC